MLLKFYIPLSDTDQNATHMVHDKKLIKCCFMNQHLKQDYLRMLPYIPVCEGGSFAHTVIDMQNQLQQTFFG
jgi:hypothetical protein